MGVWKNSPSSQKIARSMPELQPGYQFVKSNLEQSDVYGSPYSIYEYSPDPLVTDQLDLREICDWFHSHHKKLILDFVPNHLAIDSPIVSQNPDLFLKVDPNEIGKNSFLHPNGFWYSHGKDPYFDGWTDTIQWDFSNPEVEEYHINILRSIAKQCDGVRCDMAMLPLPEVFKKTHGKLSVYDWNRVIKTIKQEFHGFKFYAEVYWGLENTLQFLGFDATYDKSLFDEMLMGNLTMIANSIMNNSNLHNIRFLENHDENRAKHNFGDKSHTYFSLLSATPNIILFHDGQNLGHSKKVPVQMIQIDEEPVDFATNSFYNRAFTTISKRSNKLEYIDLQYFEFNHLPIFARKIISDFHVELILWNHNSIESSGWIQYEDGIFFKDELIDIVTGEIYTQMKKKEGLYFKLNPNQLQWFIF